MQLIEKINNSVNRIVWGTPTLALIILTGVLMCFITRFFHIRYIRHIIRETVGSIFKRKGSKSKDEKSISQFQAMCTALAATIGTGNITGVATAIAIGGPGAVFWMWVSAFFGMMTIYAENVLGIYYRRKNEKNEWCGGAMYYLRDGLSNSYTDKNRHKIKRGRDYLSKSLAIMFSFFCIIASFGIGNMTQANSISTAMNASFGVKPLAVGVILSLMTMLVIVGGVQRIGKTTEKLVPFMALFYIIGTTIVLFMNFKEIPYVFESIFKNAFGLSPVVGAGSGIVMKKAISFGFKRGVFSNEAGLGSSVTVHAASDVKEPALQGMWGIFEVFVDTIVICTLTAFVLLSSCCRPVSFEQALGNLTRETQIFSICNTDKTDIHLIDMSANPTFKTNQEKGKIYGVRTDSGKQFEVRVDKNEKDIIYTNIMALRGIRVDENGKETEDGEINTVIIEPIDGTPLVSYALSQNLGKWAGKILACAIIMFAFSTIVGWSYYGLKAWEYIFGSSLTSVYKAIYTVFVIVGATTNLRLVWSISDTFNALMALPNLIGVLLLSGKVKKITKNYVDRKIRGKNVDEMISYNNEMPAPNLRSNKAKCCVKL